MGSAAVNQFNLLEPTPRRALRIWWAWFWRWALLGGVPVALASGVGYYNIHLPEPNGVVADIAFLAGVIAPFWAYAYSFGLIFNRSIGGVQIRLHPRSAAGLVGPPAVLAPSGFVIRTIRKKLTRRSWRWAERGILAAFIVFGICAAKWRLAMGPNAPTGPESVSRVLAWVTVLALFWGAPFGWVAGTALELKSIFTEDFGEFRVCLIAEPNVDARK